MLHRLDKLTGVKIEAADGEFGIIKDVYFDDQHWTARYLVVETGSWLSSREVLISAISVQSTDWTRNRVEVGLSREQIAASPSIDTDKPVSRQHERDFLDYYGYPYYWTGPYPWGVGPYPVTPVPPLPLSGNTAGASGEAPSDPHLRSAQEVRGYRLDTTDDSLGHVEDFLLDSESWALRYLVIATRNWLPGRHVVIPPAWITGVDWTQKAVNVNVSRAIVLAAPEYHVAGEFSRAQETTLYRHYQRRGYWR